MKRIVFKIGFFIIPVFLVFLFPLLLLYFSGELLGIYDEDEKELFGLTYSYPVKFFKTKNTNKKNPEILALGSSRSMRFDKSLFKKDYSFYSAGGAINALEDFSNYWKEINEKPEYLIITIDPWWFNENHDNLKKNYFPRDFKRPGNPIKIFINQWKTVYDDLIAGKIDVFKILQNKNKSGITAIMNNEGFLKDGSYFYSEKTLSPEFDIRAKSYKNAALKKAKRFELCEDINSKALDKFFLFLDETLKTVDTNKVYIIHPPIADGVLSVLNKEEHKNYFYLNDSLRVRFKNSVFNNNYYFSKRTKNAGMIDAIHPFTSTIKNDLIDFSTKNNTFKSILKN